MAASKDIVVLSSPSLLVVELSLFGVKRPGVSENDEAIVDRVGLRTRMGIRLE
jgi:hypothetical protein